MTVITFSLLKQLDAGSKEIGDIGLKWICPLVMTNIAMENPRTKWWFIAGKIIYKWIIYTMAMLNNQMVMIHVISSHLIQCLFHVPLWVDIPKRPKVLRHAPDAP